MTIKLLINGIIITGLMTFPVLSSIASEESSFLISNRPSAQGNAKIIKQTWRILPNYYGDRGAVEYSFVVQNLTKRNMRDVKYEVATYDSSGNIVNSDYGYVMAIPAGKTRTETRRLDSYGGEKTLAIQLIEVEFAN